MFYQSVSLGFHHSGYVYEVEQRLQQKNKNKNSAIDSYLGLWFLSECNNKVKIGLFFHLEFVGSKESAAMSSSVWHPD